VTITERTHGDVVVVSLRGTLLGEPETSALREAIYRLTERLEKQVVLDLGGLKTMNSTGLGTLVAALTSLRTRDGDLRLARLSVQVHALITMTHLLKVLKVYETVERAVESFKR
jgi:anti-sigma B factor antagonist